jgi:flagellar hook-length control protein FliK
MGGTIVNEPITVNRTTAQTARDFQTEFGRVAFDRQVIRAREPEPAPQNNTGLEARPQPAPVNTPQPAPQAATAPQNHNPTQAEQVEARIIENIRDPQGSPRTEFEMTLSPQELGRVSVKMMLENGRLAVEIVTVSGRAEEVLRAQINALTTSLRATMPDLHTVQITTSTQSLQNALYGSPNAGNNSMMDGGTRESQEGSDRGRGGNAEADDDYGEQPAKNPKAPNQLLDYSI